MASLTTSTLTFRGVPRLIALESFARELGYRLVRRNPRISACNFTIRLLAERLEGDAPYAATIHLSLPNAEIHADSMRRGAGAGHGSVHAALREACENARRQVAGMTSRLRESQ